MRNRWMCALMFAASLGWPASAVPRAAGQPPAGGVASTAGTVQSAQPSPDQTTMAGAWRLNLDLSDKPGQPGNGTPGGNGAESGGGRPGGGARMGGRGGGFRGGMRGGGRIDPDAMRARMALMHEIMQSPDQFTLTFTGDNHNVSLTYADGRVFQYKADDSKEKHQLTSGTVDTKTKWNGPSLVTEYDLDGGLKIVRTYALSEKTHQLVVSTRMEGGRTGRAREMKSVYDADTQ